MSHGYKFTNGKFLIVSHKTSHGRCKYSSQLAGGGHLNKNMTRGSNKARFYVPVRRKPPLIHRSIQQIPPRALRRYDARCPGDTDARKPSNLRRPMTEEGVAPDKQEERS